MKGVHALRWPGIMYIRNQYKRHTSIYLYRGDLVKRDLDSLMLDKLILPVYFRIEHEVMCIGDSDR